MESFGSGASLKGPGADVARQAEPSNASFYQPDIEDHKTLKSLDHLVDCSLYAPARAAPSRHIMIQAFAHAPEKSEEARVMAQEHDEVASQRGFTTLETSIEHGLMLTFDLSLAHATVDVSPQHLRWVGKTGYVSFLAHIADDAQGSLIGRLIVSQNGIPIGG